MMSPRVCVYNVCNACSFVFLFRVKQEAMSKRYMSPALFCFTYVPINMRRYLDLRVTYRIRFLFTDLMLIVTLLVRI